MKVCFATTEVHALCSLVVNLSYTLSLVQCNSKQCMYSYTRTHPFNDHFSRITWVSQYQKGKTNLDFTEARDSEWQWHQLGHMQVCTSLQTDNHASTPPVSFLQARCPSCRPTNSVKALKSGVCIVNQNYYFGTSHTKFMVLWR